MKYKLHIRNPDIESCRLAYEWVHSEGSVGGWSFRGPRKIGGIPRVFWSLTASNKYILRILSPSPVNWHPCWVIWIRGGVWEPGHLVIEMHGMPPSRSRGCAQANYQQLIPNLHFAYFIKHKLHEWSKKVLLQMFWLELCTKQVISARACAYQFLPYNSSGTQAPAFTCYHLAEKP